MELLHQCLKAVTAVCWVQWQLEGNLSVSFPVPQQNVVLLSFQPAHCLAVLPIAVSIPGRPPPAEPPGVQVWVIPAAAGSEVEILSVDFFLSWSKLGVLFSPAERAARGRQGLKWPQQLVRALLCRGCSSRGSRVKLEPGHSWF